VEKTAGGMSDLFLQTREGRSILGIPPGQELSRGSSKEACSVLAE